VAALLPSVVLALVPHASAGELEQMRARYDSELRAHQKRIRAIELEGHGASTDPQERADGITRARVGQISASSAGGLRAGKSLAQLAQKASGDPSAVVDLYAGQSEQFAMIMYEWGAEGAERKKLRDAISALQMNLALTGTNLATATDAAEAMKTQTQESGVREKVARIEAEARGAGERLSARWERERALREREREQREREAGERARGLR